MSSLQLLPNRLSGVSRSSLLSEEIVGVLVLAAAVAIAAATFQGLSPLFAHPPRILK